MFKGTPGNSPQLVKNGQFIQGKSHWAPAADWTLMEKPYPSIAHNGVGTGTISQTIAGANLTDTYRISGTLTELEGVTVGVTMKAGSGHAGELLDPTGKFSVDLTFTTDTVLSFTGSEGSAVQLSGISVLRLETQP